MRPIVTSRVAFGWRIAIPPFERSESETKPVFATSTISIAPHAEMEGSIDTPGTVVVQIVLDVRPLTTITLY